MPRDPDSYEVGYGKPPSHTRFEKGRSGNPRGRAKGSKNLTTLIEQELDQRIKVNENGRRRTITKRLAVAKQIVNKAVSGDAKAIPLVLAESRQHAADAASGGALPFTSDKDQEVVLAWLQGLGDEEQQPDEV